MTNAGETAVPEEQDEAWWARKRTEALNAHLAKKGEMVRIPPPQDSRHDLQRFLAGRPRFPRLINASVADECNLRCTMCPMYGEGFGTEQTQKHHGLMTYEDWRRLVDSVPDLARTSIGPASWGEPLLNKRIFDMVEYAAGKGGRSFAFNTNGTVLTERIVDRLLDLAGRTGADLFVQVSLDGFKESCEAQRQGIEYDRVHDALCRFIERNRERGNPIRLSADLTRIHHPRGECDRFIEYWCEKGLWLVVVQSVTVQGKGGQVTPSWDRSTFLNPDLFPENPPEHFACEFLRNHLAVRSDLQAFAICCRDWFFSGKADLRQTSIAEIWNSPEYREIIRRQFYNEPGTICHNCEYKLRELSTQVERDIWYGKHLYHRIQTFYSTQHVMDLDRYRSGAG